MTKEPMKTDEQGAGPQEAKPVRKRKVAAVASGGAIQVDGLPMQGKPETFLRERPQAAPNVAGILAAWGRQQNGSETNILLTVMAVVMTKLGRSRMVLTKTDMQAVRSMRVHAEMSGEDFVIVRSKRQ